MFIHSGRCQRRGLLPYIEMAVLQIIDGNKFLHQVCKFGHLFILSISTCFWTAKFSHVTPEANPGTLDKLLQQF